MQLEKQSILSKQLSSVELNPYQLLEHIFWVNLITQNGFYSLPEDFVYVDFSNNHYTINLMAKLYPNATFYVKGPTQHTKPSNVRCFNDVSEINIAIHFVYFENISTLSASDWVSLKDQLLPLLVNNGHIVVGHENKIGWDGFSALLDLIKLEFTALNKKTITHQDLDSVFFYFNQLSDKKISIFENKTNLQRLLSYLKGLPLYKLNELILSSENTQYTTRSVFQKTEGVKYTGALPVVSNYIHLGLDEQQKEFVGNFNSNPVNAIERRDLISQPFFKMEIWEKNTGEAVQKLCGVDSLYFGVYSRADSFPNMLKVENVTFNFKGALLTKLRDVFNKHGFLKLEDVLFKLEGVDEPQQSIVSQIMVLVAAGQIKVALNPSKYKAHDNFALSKNYKIKFKHAANQDMFSDVYKFLNESGVITDFSTRLLVPFDSKMSMLFSALTKVVSSIAPQYCAEIWCKNFGAESEINKVAAEFQAILLRFQKYYLVKFLELDLVDQVLV